MKTRYKSKYQSYWHCTLVVCPSCQKPAHIHRCELECYHCGLKKTYEQSIFYKALWKLNCPDCGNEIREEQGGFKEKPKSIQVRCKVCDFQAEVTPSVYSYHTEKVDNNGLESDRQFGLPLYFQAEVRGNLFWAKNWQHLLEMERYIAADLRERHGMEMVAKLPTFIKLAKNRSVLLKIIARWKEDFLSLEKPMK